MRSSRRVSERTLLLLLACVQFTHIMDFMVVMPLEPQLMRELNMSPSAFGHIVSAFAITAGVVGLAMAPLADRFDRRKLLLICFAGFGIGTLLCGLSTTPGMLTAARALCGAFGGVSSATIMTIVADVVPAERRARGMGVIMSAFSAAAALGVPAGLKLAQMWKWEAPFLVIAVIALVVWLMLFRYLPSVRGHLDRDGVDHGKDFVVLLKDRNAWTGIALMVVCIFGHFIVIPHLATYLTGNAGLAEKDLSLVYLVGGVASILTAPWVGRLADRYGRFRIFTCMILVACGVVYHMTTSGPIMQWHVLLNAALFFTFASGRFIPAQATISLAVPPHRRGAYMSLVSCSRDLSMGIASSVGGMIVVEKVGGGLQHFEWIGAVAIAFSLGSIIIYRLVKTAEGSAGSALSAGH